MVDMGVAKGGQDKPAHLFKFLIGTLAGICAVFLPRLVGIMAASESGRPVPLLGLDYVLIGVLFALLVGAAVAIIKWKDACHPPEVFTVALGVPALIAGSFNTSKDIGETQHQTQKLEVLTNQIHSNRPNPSILPPDRGLKLGRLNGSDGPSAGFATLGLFISIAQAQAPAGLAVDKVEEPSADKEYLIVFDKTDDSEAAQALVEKLKGISPSATVVEGEAGFYVVDSVQPLNLPEATYRAVSLMVQGDRQGQSVEVGLIQLVP